MRSIYALFWLLFFLSTFVSAAAREDGGSTATGISRAFNPAISSNGLFVSAFTSEGGEDHAGEEAEGHGHGRIEEGLQVQEVEIQLSSFVDPYVKADLILAIPGAEGVELEEGYITSMGLPGSLTLKAGKFYADFGKHNKLHTHQFPFVDAPLVVERLLGDEGLNETGIGLSWLLPTSWYGELSGQVLNGDNEAFAAPDGGDLAYLAQVKNFWELGEDATLELGGAYVLGKNSFAETTRLAAADLTFKWQPVQRTVYRSLMVQTEYLFAGRDRGIAEENEGGFYTLAQYQFARRWWIQGRYDFLGLPEEDERNWRVSGLLAFVLSEFSALRLQYNRLDEENQAINKFFLQYNFTIGSHPAHRY